MDEPGAIVFFVDTVILAKIYIQRFTTRKDLFLIALLNVTLSLTHIVITLFVYLCGSRSFYKNLFRLASIICVLFLFDRLLDFDFFMSRLSYSEEKGVAGNNRHGSILLGLEVMADVLPYGILSFCDGNIQCMRGYDNIASTPLSPLLQLGVFRSLSFYLLILYLIKLTFFEIRLEFVQKVSVFCFLLLLLQRPWFFMFS
jgi:hypothetical protein